MSNNIPDLLKIYNYQYTFILIQAIIGMFVNIFIFALGNN